MKKVTLILIFMFLSGSVFGDDSIKLFGYGGKAYLVIDTYQFWEVYCTSWPWSESPPELEKTLTFSGSKMTMIPFEETFIVKPDPRKGYVIRYYMKSKGYNIMSLRMFTDDNHYYEIKAMGSGYVQLTYSEAPWD